MTNGSSDEEVDEYYDATHDGAQHFDDAHHHPRTMPHIHDILDRPTAATTAESSSSSTATTKRKAEHLQMTQTTTMAGTTTHNGEQQLHQQQNHQQAEDDTEEPPEKRQRRPADHTGGPWTEEQDAYLEHLIKQGLKVLPIQKAFEERFNLGRSHNAVRNRIKKVRARTMDLSAEEIGIIKEEIKYVQDPQNLARIVVDRIRNKLPNVSQGVVERFMKDDEDVRLTVALDSLRKGKVNSVMKTHLKLVMGSEPLQTPKRRYYRHQPNVTAGGTTTTS